MPSACALFSDYVSFSWDCVFSSGHSSFPFSLPHFAHTGGRASTFSHDPHLFSSSLSPLCVCFFGFLLPFMSCAMRVVMRLAMRLALSHGLRRACCARSASTSWRRTSSSRSWPASTATTRTASTSGSPSPSSARSASASPPRPRRCRGRRRPASSLPRTPPPPTLNRPSLSRPSRATRRVPQGAWTLGSRRPPTPRPHPRPPSADTATWDLRDREIPSRRARPQRRGGSA
mmetsp:Transcript_52370/g.119418  ORF Transcript_52370/g.119418 Transcript_52370/m.119418 type:complete len:231 (-) Transcript_52370:767-1459(-)